MAEINYVGWVQAMLATVVIIGAPSEIQSLYARLKGKLAILSMPVDFDDVLEVSSWIITIENFSRRTLKKSLSIYPDTEKVVATSVVCGPNDGGLNVKSYIKNGYVQIDIDRLGINRYFDVVVNFSRASIPVVESDDGHLTHRVFIKHASPSYRSVQIAKIRLKVLLWQFTVAVLIILFYLFKK